MLGTPGKNVTKLIGFRDLLHLDTGISNGNETIAGFFRSDLLCDPLEEILLVDVRLKRAAGLAGHDADRAL